MKSEKNNQKKLKTYVLTPNDLWWIFEALHEMESNFRESQRGNLENESIRNVVTSLTEVKIKIGHMMTGSEEWLDGNKR